MTLTPAYGRDYKSRKEALAAFNEGREFYAQSYNGSGYTTKEELKSQGIRTVQIRYKQQREVFIVNL